MTNLEALQASLIYPVEEAKLIKALFDRDLFHLDDYIKSKKMLMDLTTADVLSLLVTAPDIKEGGYSITLSDKQALMKTASGIYLKYGEQDPFNKVPTVTSSSPW
jgi:hypothetical protein